MKIIIALLFLLVAVTPAIAQSKIEPPARICIVPVNAFDLPPMRNHGIACTCPPPAAQTPPQAITIESEQDKIDALNEKIKALAMILEATRERLAIIENYCLRLERERRAARMGKMEIPECEK